MSVIYWLGLVVLFAVLEACTANLVSIWFALGAVAGAVCTALGLRTGTAVTAFVLVSALALIVFKKLFGDKLSVKKEATNADRLIGTKAVVCEDIDSVKNTGAVEASGLTWSAKSDVPLKKGAVVEVVDIKGVKLIVREVLEVK
ncbi:MAG: NfeD family protein [Clostridia bacterium]|nr:NfeD family protein [Clostridia bacterium]